MRRKIATVCYPLIIVMSLWVTVSCNNNEQEKKIGYDTKKIVFDEIKDSLPVSQFFKSVKYITLETNKNSIIGSLTKVIVANNRILVFDKQQSKLFLFDLSGKHLATTYLEGKGLNEMVRITDCDFNLQTKQYGVLGDQNKLILLDTNLNPIKEQVLNYKGIHFAFIKMGYALNTHFYINTDKNDDPITQVIVFNDQSKILNRYFSNPIAKVINHSPSFSFFRSDGVIFTLPCSNKMLWIKEKEVEEWEIDFGRYDYDYNDLYEKAVKGEIDFDDIYNTKDKVSFYSHAYLVNNLLHFKGLSNRQFITCFYDFGNNKCYALKKMYNDLNDYPLGRIKAATKDCFVYVISTEEVYESSLNDSLKLNLVDNPILAFYYE